MPSSGITEHDACVTQVQTSARTVETDICSAIAAYTFGPEEGTEPEEPVPEPTEGGFVYVAGVYAAGVYQ